MSKKLLLKVIHVSGNEEGFGGKELEIHSPTTKGWQSSRFCVYPQEIILCLKESAFISKIQILSHQYNIASKIEVFLSMPATPGTMSLVGCKFKRLGYVHMSTNEGTQYQARELKSVHVNAEGQLVKLILHKNHVNKFNLYNQVCLVAVNVLGQSLAKQYEEEFPSGTDDLMNYYMNQVHSNESHLNPAPLHQSRYNDSDIVSPLDDLSFDMYQDPETAQLIRKLDDKKRQAIQEERYDYAKKLKQAMADLHKVGERLGKFEVEKRRAVEMENFDLAKSKKLSSDEYRLHVYKQLDIFDLLEIDKTEEKKGIIPVHKNAFEDHSYTPTKAHKSEEDIKLPPVKTISKRSPQHVSRIEESSTSIMPQIHSPRIAIDYADQNDERPLPALKGKSSHNLQDDDVEHATNAEGEDQDLKALSEKEEREAELIIEVFGMNIAKQIHSKNWKHRQESITNLTVQLSNPDELSDEHTPKLIARASLQVLNKTLQDQVYVVLQNSVDFLKTLLLTYIPNSTLGKTDTIHVLEKVIPTMLKRTGDTALRSRSMMTESIIEIAKQAEVKNLGIVTNILTTPIKAKKLPPWRLFKSQIEVMNILIKDLGIETHGGFTTERIMKILVSGFKHANNEVREASLKCIFDVYKIVKDPIKSYFPPDQPSNRKNPLLCKLYDGFDRVDGKPTESERKALAKKQKDKAEQNKQTEIEALQSQLKELRSMTSQKIIENKENLVEDDNNNKNETTSTTAATTTNKKNTKNATKSKPNLKQQVSVRKTKEPVKRESKAKTRTKPDQQQNTVPDKLCIFCGEENEIFSEEGLDVHYWKTCPMLKRCDACMQVVEISSMSNHLLTECEKKGDYLKCKICQSAIKKNQEKEHLESPQCNDIKTKENHEPCPLCLQLIPSHDDAWREHLIHKCKTNLERMKLGKGTTPSKSKTVVRGIGARGGGRGGGPRGRGRGSSVSKLPTRTPSKKK